MVTLITGGSRSGKTRFALERAGDREPRAYLATAELLDEEMRDRATRHRSERGGAWVTIEEPLNITEHLSSKYASVVVDCLTLWLSNWMLKDAHAIEDQISRLKNTLKAPPCDVVLVTNEVGCSIVPDNRLARDFCDWSGRMNQHMGEISDAVYMMVCGIPLRAK